MAESISGPSMASPKSAAPALLFNTCFVLFVVSATSLGVYGISFGGWASNSKYSLLGGLRSSAQIISYEIAMGLALVSATVKAWGGSTQVEAAAQGGARFVFHVPLAEVSVVPAAAGDIVAAGKAS